MEIGEGVIKGGARSKLVNRCKMTGEQWSGKGAIAKSGKYLLQEFGFLLCHLFVLLGPCGVRNDAVAMVHENHGVVLGLDLDSLFSPDISCRGDDAQHGHDGTGRVRIVR